jgi:hypothetical protein
MTDDRLELAFLSHPDYGKGMVQAKKIELDNSAQLLDEEDEATLTLLRQRIKSSDEGRLIASEEVRERMKKWLTKSSTTKTR